MEAQLFLAIQKILQVSSLPMTKPCDYTAPPTPEFRIQNLVPYVLRDKPRLFLCNRFDYTIATIKYLLPAPLVEQRVVVIPTAITGQPEEARSWLEPQDLAPLRTLGLELNLFDITGKSEAEVRSALSTATVIVVTGGDTYHLLKQMRACNFEKILRERLAAGAVYMASSAGTVVCCPDIDFIAPMDNPEKAGLTNFKGMGLVPFAVVPHLNHPHMAGAAHIIMQKSVREGTMMLGLKDEQFLVVNENTYQVF